MVSTYRAACAQLDIGKDVAANLATCLATVDTAAAAGARLIVLPELCNHPGPFEDREAAWTIAEEEDGPWAKEMAGRAKKHGAYVAYNILVRCDRPSTLIMTYLLDPAGTLLARYAKQVLFATQADWSQPGPLPLPVVTTPLGKLGIYICMDGLIPEPTRVLQLLGGQVLINALNSAGPDEADLHVPARAAEVRAWVLSANKVGRMSATHAAVYAGGSAIVAPDGTTVARASDDKEEIIYADITPALADDKSIGEGDDLVRDRRPALYGPLVAPKDGFPAYMCRAEPERKIGFGAVQVNARSPDDRTVIDRAIAHIEELAAAGTRIVVLPEAFLWAPGAVVADPAAAEQTSRAAENRLQQLCRRRGVLVAANMVEAGEGGRWYNTVFLLGPDGEVGRYRQVHVRAADRCWASPGNGFPVFDTPYGRLGLMVGYDGLFPETARIMALNGAAAILYPCSWRLKAEPDLIVIERAAENHVAVIAANRTDSVVAAGSRIISGARYPTPQHWRMRFPDSTTLDHGVEEAKSVMIDVGAMAQKLIAYKTDLVADRMPEHYSLLVS